MIHVQHHEPKRFLPAARALKHRLEITIERPTVQETG